MRKVKYKKKSVSSNKRVSGEKLGSATCDTSVNVCQEGLNRRSFIGLGLTSAAAPLILKTTPANAQQGQGSKARTGAESNNLLPVSNPLTASESWNEPWVWNPRKWPGETLHMNVVEHQTASSIVGLGNSSAVLFSYNGSTPGPTIRMKGDETLKVKLFNHLNLNSGSTVVGEAPDPAYYMTDRLGNRLGYNKEDFTFKYDWELGEHLNGIHSIHTTNLHTHGLHVRPGLNSDGTHSDNIYLRVIPPADLDKRESDRSYDGDLLLEGEQAGEASYEFRLGQNNGRKIDTHPPGTHWYHPHCHGSTNMEVASGMAGFLVVEGDVDEAINLFMTGKKEIDTTQKTGPYGYRERLMMLQRVFAPPVDQDSMRPGLKKGAVAATNGSPQADIIVMRPGDVERWRVLNGSVDGKGYIRFMVLEGQWANEKPTSSLSFMGGKKRSTKLPKISQKLNGLKQLIYVDENGERLLPSTEDIEARKQQLYLLAKDGVTLVKETRPGEGEYMLKDLSNKNKNPLFQDFSNLSACYESPENLKASYNLPNELYMAPANRADFFFEAPQLPRGSSSKVYTVIAKGSAIHTENEERAIDLFNHYSADDGMTAPPFAGNPNVPGDTVIAYVIVKECDGSDSNRQNCSQPIGASQPTSVFSMANLQREIAKVPVPKYLRPITAEEVKIKKGDVDGGENTGKYRTRKLTYSGWGAATWPNLYAKKISKADPSGPEPVPNPNMVYDPVAYGVPSEFSKGPVMIPPSTRTMAIDGKKFNPDDEDAPRPLLGTAEEWVVYNNSISLFAKYPEIPNQPSISNSAKAFILNHLDGHPITREQAKRNGFGIATRGIDHPFHIHTNPFWLMRVEVPDESGKLVNILPEPCWHDVMWIPRNGGRIVFRSRFPDFVGKMVNHCHILQHEDNGMMQEVTITQSLARKNYTTSAEISTQSMGEEAVDALSGSYARDSLADAYRQCTRVVDDNHMDRPELPLAFEYPAPNGVFDPPELK